MRSTEILMLLAQKHGAYILGDIGTGEIVLREADGSDMTLVDDDGRQLSKSDVVSRNGSASERIPAPVRCIFPIP